MTLQLQARVIPAYGISPQGWIGQSTLAKSLSRSELAKTLAPTVKAIKIPTPWAPTWADLLRTSTQTAASSETSLVPPVPTKTPSTCSILSRRSPIASTISTIKNFWWSRRRQWNERSRAWRKWWLSILFWGAWTSISYMREIPILLYLRQRRGARGQRLTWRKETFLLLNSCAMAWCFRQATMPLSP